MRVIPSCDPPRVMSAIDGRMAYLLGRLLSRVATRHHRARSLGRAEQLAGLVRALAAALDRRQCAARLLKPPWPVVATEAIRCPTCCLSLSDCGGAVARTELAAGRASRRARPPLYVLRTIRADGGASGP